MMPPRPLPPTLLRRVEEHGAPDGAPRPTRAREHKNVSTGLARHFFLHFVFNIPGERGHGSVTDAEDAVSGLAKRIS